MGEITVVGHGWRRGQLTLEAVEALTSGECVILHTGHCACAAWLTEQGRAYETLDRLYEDLEDFDDHAQAAAQAVLKAAEDRDVVYGVFDIRDRSVEQLLKRSEGKIGILAGPPSEGALLARAPGETRCLAASDWEDFHLSARENSLIREMDSRELACEVKLKLMEVYPEDTTIWLMTGEGAIQSMPLYEMDRSEGYDHRTCALIPAHLDITTLERYDAEHLNQIMRRLCAPDGCPWDRVQTHETLRPYILEEAYEVIEAIDEASPEHLYDELGDMLLQVALHAEIGRKHGEFDITDVTTAICQKMIKRHTHVFGGDHAGSAGEVLGLWTKNKMAERGQRTRTETMQDITRTLPATLRAVKVMKRAAEAGIGAESQEETLRRCREALAQAGESEAALGDLLILLCDLARQRGIDPELALNGACERFIHRFDRMERDILSKGEEFDALSPDKLREYWGLVKL